MKWKIFNFLLLLFGILAVDQSKFRRCDQTAFCRKYRKPLSFSSMEEEESWQRKKPQYSVTASTLINDDSIEFELTSSVVPHIIFHVKIYGLENGSVRLKLVEKNPLHQARWVAPDIVNELNTCKWKPLQSFDAIEKETTIDPENSRLYQLECAENSLQLLLSFSPFKIQIFVENKQAIVINDKQLFHYDYHRTKETDPQTNRETTTENEDIHQGKTIVDYGEDGLAIYSDGTVQPKRQLAAELDDATKNDDVWEEQFGSYSDSKPFGPASVGMDFSFPQCEHVFGIPEHATDFSLKATRNQNSETGDYKEPYRLYNLDVFEYDLDVPMALYGSIPLLIAHSLDHTIGLYWNNPTETFIDIENSDDPKNHKHSHWISESGIIDVFFFPGITIQKVLKQYTSVTGLPYLPPLFSLGYHQCRWNYKNEKDVAKVNAGFEKHVIPMDVIWLDIEHTDGKRYFTWDSNAFPTPLEMQKNIAHYARKMVTIVDPHIKRDDNYHVHKMAVADNVYVKQKDGVSDFDGWCWPGSSSYVDFTSERARRWWAERFRLTEYIGSTLDLYTWNDMNEMSVFNGPEITMQKDNKNLDGIEQREWHNLYGMYMHRATGEGQLLRHDVADKYDKHRQFVLSRAFFAGTQKYGAIWTGDNEASWKHLEYSTKMLLSMSITSLVFVGADVGGFFGNPDVQLLTRWYQAAIYQPFFRGHAHHDAKRREPYLIDEPHRSIIRQAIITRYNILPYLYTLFYQSSTEGLPVMRPIWFHYPKEEKIFGVDHQFLLGSDLLIQPVVEENKFESTVYLPKDSIWYNTNTHQKYIGGNEFTVDSPLERIPVFQRGGSIIMKKLRVRRSSQLMVNDPYTMYIALEETNSASGLLYVDDGLSHQYQKAKYLLKKFQYQDNTLTSTTLNEPIAFHELSQLTVERIIILGMKEAPQSVWLTNDKQLEFVFEQNVLTIRKPDIQLSMDNWKIQLKL